jgi:hypothetical protein
MAVSTQPQPTLNYADSLIADLGDNDAMTVFADLVPRLRATLVEVGDVDLEAPEAPGRWSIRNVIDHLVDGDIVLAFRTRMVLAHDNPPLASYDQDLWTQNLARTRGTIDEALEELEVVRGMNTRLFQSLSETELQRTGLHSERGPESLDRMLKLYAGHDCRHLRQIRRIAEAVRGSSG